MVRSALQRPLSQIRKVFTQSRTKHWPWNKDKGQNSGYTAKETVKIVLVKGREYVNCELPDVPAGFRKGRGTRDQIANICWIFKQASSRKTSISALLTVPKPSAVWITINCGKRWEYQTTWPASWETYMQVRKQQLELDMDNRLFQIGKGVRQCCILVPCLFNLHAEYTMRNAGLDEAQAGIKIAGRNINNLRYADDTTLMAESEEELKKPLDESEWGEWKSWLKAQHSEN